MSDRLKALSVHLLTATGAVLSMFAMLAAVEGKWDLMFLWLVVALIVDGVDGPLARKYDTQKNWPTYDGVLLDLMSDPVAGNQSAVVSLNYYIRPTTDKIRFIGTAIGNVVSHEAGHYIGNFHTENSNSVSSLMDSGGMGFWRMFQAGPDRIGGTADDGDTDFTTDRFALLVLQP